MRPAPPTPCFRPCPESPLEPSATSTCHAATSESGAQSTPTPCDPRVTAPITPPVARIWASWQRVLAAWLRDSPYCTGSSLYFAGSPALAYYCPGHACSFAAASAPRHASCSADPALTSLLRVTAR